MNEVSALGMQAILTMTLFETTLLSLFLIITLSIVWGTIRTGISPMMSSLKARQAMVSVLNEHQQTKGLVMDLGSGWGSLLIAAAKQYPHKQFIGYELSFLPWLISNIRKQVLGLKNIKFYRKDFLKEDLRDASILFCFLYPQAMEKLKSKLEKENVINRMVISNTFALPDHEAKETIKLNDFYGTPIYVYKL